MYSSPVPLIGIGFTGLALTGFPVAQYFLAALIIIVSGLLLLRLGHRCATR